MVARHWASIDGREKAGPHECSSNTITIITMITLITLITLIAVGVEGGGLRKEGDG